MYSEASKKEIFGTVRAVAAEPDANFALRYGPAANAPAGAPQHHGAPGIVTINSTTPITEYLKRGTGGGSGGAGGSSGRGTGGNSGATGGDGAAAGAPHHHPSHGRLDPDAARCPSPGFGDPPVPAGAPKTALVGFGHDDTSDEEVRQKRMFGRPVRR
jgi:hypothetical protein